MRISDWSSDVCSSDLSDSTVIARMNTAPKPSASAQVMCDGRGAFLLRLKRIAGLLGKGLKIAHGMRIGGHNLQHLSAFKLRQGFLGTQDRQGAFQAGSINFHVGLRQEDRKSTRLNSS